MPQNPEVGSLVEARGQRWQLTRAQSFDRCTLLSLEGRDRSNAMERIHVIAPFDRPRRIAPRSLQRKRRDYVIQHALAAIHSTNAPDGLWTAAAARMDLHAYQLEPALAAVGGATRLLLADAVGLGKTIQAGLLLSELQQRGWVERALIVCPAGLRDTWRSELHGRFGIDAAVVDQPSIADRVAVLPRGVNPWTTNRVAIVSIDFIKRAEVLAALDGVPIDLLIADEAHHLAPATDRGSAVARLAARAVWCVLLSATPHSGDRDAFEYLTSLGRLSDRIIIFRRSRQDAGLDHSRRVHFRRVRATANERALFDAIERYSRAIWAGRGRDDHAARLVAITIARRATSSVAAIQRTLRRRLELLGTVVPPAAQPLLPWQDEEAADGDAAEGILSARGLDDVTVERLALEELIAIAARCDIESKIVRLLRLLTRIHEPAIIFTEYRDTLDTIVAAVQPRHRVASIYGALPLEQRRLGVDTFNSGDCDVLVATDAAGEGLNLHHRCRLVIDFELPWNPLRLEQRIGRVDRLGQRRTVHAIRLFHGGTIEQDVLDRLSLRQRRAQADLAAAVAELDVAKAVFEHADVAPAAAPVIDTECIAGSASELSRLRDQRRWGVHFDQGRYWAKPRRAGTRRLLIVGKVTMTNAGQFVTGDHVRSHAVSLTSRPQSLREWRATIEHAARTILADDVFDSNALDQVHARIKAIRSHVARLQRREYQRSLFDGRADLDQIERERAAARLNAALERVERAIALPERALDHQEVVAAWPEPRT